MPIYEYVCSDCGYDFERLQSFNEPRLETCPECRGQVRRVISAAGVIFKGSGWYITDSRRQIPDKSSGKPKEATQADASAGEAPKPTQADASGGEAPKPTQAEAGDGATTKPGKAEAKPPRADSAPGA